MGSRLVYICLRQTISKTVVPEADIFVMGSMPAPDHIQNGSPGGPVTFVKAQGLKDLEAVAF
jgi:hypothetical protein